MHQVTQMMKPKEGIAAFAATGKVAKRMKEAAAVASAAATRTAAVHGPAAARKQEKVEAEEVIRRASVTSLTTGTVLEPPVGAVGSVEATPPQLVVQSQQVLPRPPKVRSFKGATDLVRCTLSNTINCTSFQTLSDQDQHSRRMPSLPTPARLKLLKARDAMAQLSGCSLSRVFTCLTGLHCASVQTLKATAKFKRATAIQPPTEHVSPLRKKGSFMTVAKTVAAAVKFKSKLDPNMDPMFAKVRCAFSVETFTRGCNWLTRLLT
jgi:hypothetical protein